MKTLVALVLIVGSCLSVRAQDASTGIGTFHFKSAYLGMSLDDFKTAMAGDPVLVNPGKHDIFGRGSKKTEMRVATPLCTDTFREFPGDYGELANDEVLCNPSPGDANPQFLEILGGKLSSMAYRFYKGKLYDITLFAPPYMFSEIESAFIRKYGPETKSGSTPYQNAYGATWSGRDVYWYTPTQSVTIHEGSGNGPAQGRSFHESVIFFMDRSLAPPLQEDRVLDF